MAVSIVYLLDKNQRLEKNTEQRRKAINRLEKLLSEAQLKGYQKTPEWKAYAQAVHALKRNPKYQAYSKIARIYYNNPETDTF